MNSRTDYQRYQELTNKLVVMAHTPEACISRRNRMAVWAEIEQIKNRHGGNIPPADSDATKTKQTVN